MAEGATLRAPETVFLSHDTVIGKDVVIEPHVVIGPKVSIADGVTIRSFCHIEAAQIGEGATIGPFARLRPGAHLARNAHVGNFVEIKQAEIGEGAKINHLTYIGDASVGARANVGAGTITCNYDGVDKHRTEIGAGAFIGSNSSLVAPVKIGEGAYVGSGSVISKDVPPDALALTRAPQEERPGWAAKLRARRKGKPKDGGNS
jgi:bifunctional UDP-N-acetylglucosamine pyrophosphorylase/glucosamine-1-phosphate N-acetyltransferase